MISTGIAIGDEWKKLKSDFFTKEVKEFADESIEIESMKLKWINFIAILHLNLYLKEL